MRVINTRTIIYLLGYLSQKFNPSSLKINDSISINYHRIVVNTTIYVYVRLLPIFDW